MVSAELVRRGYTETGSHADFLVRIGAGSARVDKPQPTTTGGTENDLQSITAGEVVVDVFDGGTSQQVWHATAKAEIDPERINEPGLEAAVQRMLTPFPARRE
jgi:hypothetical protein